MRKSKRRIPKMIDGTQLCKEEKRVGYCWCAQHYGYINKRLILEHDCINKKCQFFEKLDRNSKYWDAKKERDEGKNKKQREKDLLDFIRKLAIEETIDYDCAISSVIRDGKNIKILIATLEYINFHEITSTISEIVRNEMGVETHIVFQKIQNNNHVIEIIIDKIISEDPYYKELLDVEE